MPAFFITLFLCTNVVPALQDCLCVPTLDYLLLSLLRFLMYKEDILLHEGHTPKIIIVFVSTINHFHASVCHCVCVCVVFLGKTSIQLLKDQ